MKKTFSTSTTLLSTLFAVATSIPLPEQHNLTVSTTSGIVSGIVDSKYPDVRQFLGIPYAQPPIDSLRFEPPRLLNSSHTHVNASSPPYSCPQLPPAGRSVFTVSAPQFVENENRWDEDCLALSLWVPTSKHIQEKVPVIIFTHGGGLQSGSSSVVYQQPERWVERSKSHIVVNIQYRLNIFGFPNGAGLNRTNLGLLDQRMAIEWVRDNVAAFGGDPDRVVLWGQSSGAGSVDAQNFAYPDDPIVQGFIQDSGSAYFPPGTGLTTFDPSHSNFSTMAKGLGCPSDPEGEASCMRKQSAKDILSYMGNYSMKATSDPDKFQRLNFVATPDEITVFSNYTERYAHGKLSTKPSIFGSNTNEGVVMTMPFPSDPRVKGVNQTEADAFTLEIYQCPAYDSGRERTTAGRKTYQYIYAGNFSDVSPLFWEGAYHMSELPQIFGTRGDFRAAATDYEIKTSEAMQDLWLGFAKDPENAAKAGWAEVSTGKMLMLGEAGGDPVKKVDISKINAACIKEGLS